MNTALFKLCAIVLTVGLLSALLPNSSFAQTLTLSQPLEHEGLTFSSPLSYNGSTHLLKSITLEFGTVDEIDIQPTTQQQIAVEMIVTPTPAPETLTDVHPDYTTGLVTPTPTNTPLPNQKAQAITASPSVSPTDTPTPTLTRVVTSPSGAGGLNADVLFSMVNSYRETKGLPAFQKDEKSCSLAASRAPEIEQEVATNTMHSGLRARNLPYWNTENIISMRNETEAFNWWINDQIHKDAIESSNTYSCMACTGNSCAEEFTNYQMK